MKKILFALVMGSTVALLSCSDDPEPTPDPILGEWEVDEYEFTDLDPSFSIWADTYTTLFGEDSYTIEFSDIDEDGEYRYQRELDFGSQGDAEDEGEWEKDDDNTELELDPDDAIGLPTDFKILFLDKDDMELSAPDEFFLLADEWFNLAVEEGYTQEQYDSLYNAQGENVSLTVIYRFEKN